MPRYDAPVRDMQFVLHEVLQLQNYSNLPGFAEATPETIDQILEEVLTAKVLDFLASTASVSTIPAGAPAPAAPEEPAQS